MRRVLMVSPQFPPDTNAGAHRVRLLAPHLPRYGWEPTVVAVDARDYEGRLDEGLAALVPPGLRVVRCRAWPAAFTRRLGIGDLGLRALSGLYRTCARLLRREPFDALVITIFPAFPAVLGPVLKRRFGIPFALDYVDPWVGAWGRTVGGRPDGGPDLKSRLSYWSGRVLEPRVVAAADALTAVSAATYEQVFARYPRLRRVLSAEIPFGGEPADVEALRRAPRSHRHFDSRDGDVHLCYVGTLLPLGMETLRAVLGALARLRDREPALYARLRLHFFGTSNRTDAGAPGRVLPVARELGVEQRVSEVGPRIDYLEALTVQADATALLLMGSSEPHYTASKLYPALLARRPLLAVYHESSTVASILRRAGRAPTVRLVTYDDARPAGTRVEAVLEALAALAARPVYDPTDVVPEVLASVSAERQAGVLADVLDRIVEAGPGRLAGAGVPVHAGARPG